MMTHDEFEASAKQFCDEFNERLAEPTVKETRHHRAYRMLKEAMDSDRENIIKNMPDIEFPTESQKRKPLTDEEMRGCAQAMDAEPLAEGWTELIKFAQAIEQAHGIGGEE